MANEIADTTGTEGAAFSYVVPENAFADADTGDTLTLSATLSDGSDLPDWLTFTAAQRKFASTELPDAAVGTTAIKVTASDGTDSVSDTFDLVVTAHCDAPDFAGRRKVWQSTLTVALGGGRFWGWSAGEIGSLDDDDFELGSATYTFTDIMHREDDGGWLFDFTPQNTMTESQANELRVHVCDKHIDVRNYYEFEGGQPDPTRFVTSFFKTGSDPYENPFDWSGLVGATRTVAVSADAEPGPGRAAGNRRHRDRRQDPDRGHERLSPKPTDSWASPSSSSGFASRTAPRPASPSATSSTYVLTAAAEGAKIKLRVKYKDNLDVEGQEKESVESDESGTIVAADTLAPTVTSIARQSPTTSPTNADSLTWRVTFSENVKNVEHGRTSIRGRHHARR